MKNNPNKTITRDFGKKDRHTWLQQFKSPGDQKELRRYQRKKGSEKHRWLLMSMMMAGGLAISMLPKHAMATNVEVFTTSQIPVLDTPLPGVSIHVYELDQLASELQDLNNQLQNVGDINEEQAGILFAGALPDFQQSFQGLELADQYGVTQLPTMVFDDGKAQVVGITNVSEGIARYESWRVQQ